MNTRLRNALAAGEFVLHWQPVFSLEDKKIVSIEALLRWEDPERGLITAAEFVPMAEQMGLIERIDAWVVDAIARQAREWRDEGLEPRVSFNISGRELRRPRQLADMAERLSASGLDPSTFTVEVSEASAMEEGGRYTDALHDLHKAGLGIAIDRFNSGLSSLRRLRDLPLAALKIDGSCVGRGRRRRGRGFARHRHHRLRGRARRDGRRRGRRDRGSAALPRRQRLPHRPGLPPGGAGWYRRDHRASPP